MKNTTKNSKDEKNAAIIELLEMGAVNEKKENRYGETQSGWWIDDVCLGKDPMEALRSVKG